MQHAISTHLGFVSLQVRNLETSKQFYSEILGFKLAPAPNQHAVVFTHESGAVFAIRTPLINLDEIKNVGAGIALWFGIANLEEYFTEISSRANIIRGVENTPFGKTFLVADPDGYILTFQQI